MAWAPALSEMSALVRLTIKSRPSVSTAMCRLRPMIGQTADHPIHAMGRASRPGRHLFAGVIAPRPAMRRFHRLAVEDTTRRADFPSRPFAIQHQRHVVDGAEQQETHEAAEPPVHRLPCQLR
jgi:hypothetical protein